MEATAEGLKDNGDYVRCPRCRVYHRMKMNWDGLCDRCCQVMTELQIDAEEIKLAYAKQADYYHISNYNLINGEWVRK